MKKLFTLIAGFFIAAAAFAAAPNSAVLLRNNSNYRVVIDGRTYTQSNTRIEMGQYGYDNQAHRVEVYEVRRGLFSKNRLISTKTFYMDQQRDVMVMVDNSGDIRIQQVGNDNTNRRNRGDNGLHKGWYKNKKNRGDRNGGYNDNEDDRRYEPNDRRNQEDDRRYEPNDRKNQRDNRNMGERERRNRREY